MVRVLLRRCKSWLAALGMLLLAVTFTPVVSWWNRILSGPWYAPQGEILIVLAGDGGTPTLGEYSYWRSLYAVRAWRQGSFRQVVLSGAGAVEAMRDFLVCQGVPISAILLENRSHSTRENALYTSLLLAPAPGHKTLLTSDYHMLRAHRAFQKAGVQALPCPFPDAGKRAVSLSRRWTVFVDLTVETVKIIYYRARSWI